MFAVRIPVPAQRAEGTGKERSVGDGAKPSVTVLQQGDRRNQFFKECIRILVLSGRIRGSQERGTEAGVWTVARLVVRASRLCLRKLVHRVWRPFEDSFCSSRFLWDRFAKCLTECRFGVCWLEFKDRDQTLSDVFSLVRTGSIIAFESHI